MLQRMVFRIRLSLQQWQLHCISSCNAKNPFSQWTYTIASHGALIISHKWNHFILVYTHKVLALMATIILDDLLDQTLAMLTEFQNHVLQSGRASYRGTTSRANCLPLVPRSPFFIPRKLSPF